MLLVGLGGTAWWQYRSFTNKRAKAKQDREDRMNKQRQEKLSQMASSSRDPTDRRDKLMNSDSDNDPRAEKARSELVHKNRVSAGFEATKAQQKELDVLQKQIRELEGKFGNDFGPMMENLKNLQAQTDMLGKQAASFNGPKKRAPQLANQESESD